MTNQKVNARYSPEARDIYFTVPNLISALRIISIPFISVLISKHEMIAALALIAISSASDGLDGIIARRFNQVSKIGQILDPIADRLLIFCSILALSVAGIIPWWMLIIVGLRDLWMAIQVLWLCLLYTSCGGIAADSICWCSSASASSGWSSIRCRTTSYKT